MLGFYGWRMQCTRSPIDLFTWSGKFAQLVFWCKLIGLINIINGLYSIFPLIGNVRWLKQNWLPLNSESSTHPGFSLVKFSTKVPRKTVPLIENPTCSASHVPREYTAALTQKCINFIRIFFYRLLQFLYITHDIIFIGYWVKKLNLVT